MIGPSRRSTVTQCIGRLTSGRGFVQLIGMVVKILFGSGILTNVGPELGTTKRCIKSMKGWALGRVSRHPDDRDLGDRTPGRTLGFS